MLENHFCPILVRFAHAICTYGVSICCFATRYMVALRPFDIFLATLEIRYVAFGNEGRNTPCFSPRRAYRVAEQHIEPKAISSDASAAHIDVESSRQRHDRLNVGHKTKRYIFVPKMGVTTKGIFILYFSHSLLQV